MAQSIAEFFVDIGVKGDGALTLKSMVGHMADMKLETLGEIGAIAALASAFKSAGQEAMRMSLQYTALKNNFDVNTTMVQRWQNVARSVASVTVSPEGVQQSFQQLAKLLSGPLAGDPSSSFFQAAGRLLGHNVQGMKAEDVEEMLRVRAPEFVKEMEAKGATHQGAVNATNTLLAQMGQQLGMLSLFSVGPKQFARGEASSNILGAGDIQKWAQLSKQVDVLGHNFEMMGIEILTKALPQLLSWGNALLRAEKRLDGFLAERWDKAGDVASMPYFVPGGGSDTAHAVMAFLATDFLSRHLAKVPAVTFNNHVYLQDKNGGQKKISQTTGKFGVTQNDLTQTQLIHADMMAW